MDHYNVVQWVGKVSYALRLPSKRALVHQVFQVSMLKKCIDDRVSILLIEWLGVDNVLYYKEVSMEILDLKVKNFRKKRWPP